MHLVTTYEMEKYKVLIDQAKIQSAIELIKKSLESSGERMSTFVKSQGGPDKNASEIFWLKDEELWGSIFERSEDCWIGFGFDLPDSKKHVWDRVQCSLQKQGYNRDMGGVLLEAEERIFLAHTGHFYWKKGETKEQLFTFWNKHIEPSVSATWPDGRAGDVILVAEVQDNPEFLNSIISFVRLIDGYKSKKELPKTVTSYPIGIGSHLEDEESTTRYEYNRSAGKVEVTRLHAFIINGYRAYLESKGIKSVRTFRADALICGENETTIIEAKTLLSSTNIQQAIGQLYYYECLHGSRVTKRVLLPYGVDDETKRVLKTLSIELVEYQLNDSEIYFIDNFIPKS